VLTINDIPMSWLHTLWDIQKVCPSAVIAGDALRDLWHGKPVKDIDIFIEAGGDTEAWGLYQLLGGEMPEDIGSRYGLADLADMEDGGAYPQSMSEVSLVQNYPGENETGLPVQLIFVNWKTEAITKRFDMGICRIWCDGNSVQLDQEFTDDSSDKLLNIRRCENKWMLGASIKRYARLLEKYDDWDLALSGFDVKEVDNDPRRV
jgi:hypothetical protein